jgi:hypothetical protein
LKGAELPNTIFGVEDNILNQVIECEQTKRLFKIEKQELDFYRKYNLPLPHIHPDLRHAKRILLRNSRKLIERNCDKCNKNIQTTYMSDRPEVVYCEECYNKEIYV